MSTHRQLPNNTDIAPWQKKGRWYHFFLENTNSNPTIDNPGSIKIVPPPASDDIGTETQAYLIVHSKSTTESTLPSLITAQGAITPLATTDEISNASNLVLGHVFKVDNDGNYTDTGDVVPFDFASNNSFNAEVTLSTNKPRLFYRVVIIIGGKQTLFASNIKCTSAVDTSGREVPLNNLHLTGASGGFAFECNYNLLHADIWMFAHITDVE